MVELALFIYVLVTSSQRPLVDSASRITICKEVTRIDKLPICSVKLDNWVMAFVERISFVAKFYATVAYRAFQFSFGLE